MVQGEVCRDGLVAKNMLSGRQRRHLAILVGLSLELISVVALKASSAICSDLTTIVCLWDVIRMCTVHVCVCYLCEHAHIWRGNLLNAANVFQISNPCLTCEFQ